MIFELIAKSSGLLAFELLLSSSGFSLGVVGGESKWMYLNSSVLGRIIISINYCVTQTRICPLSWFKRGPT